MKCVKFLLRGSESVFANLLTDEDAQCTLEEDESHRGDSWLTASHSYLIFRYHLRFYMS